MHFLLKQIKKEYINATILMNIQKEMILDHFLVYLLLCMKKVLLNFNNYRTENM